MKIRSCPGEDTLMISIAYNGMLSFVLEIVRGVL